MDNASDSGDCFCELCSLDFTTHRVSVRFACSIHKMYLFGILFYASIYLNFDLFDGSVTL